MQEAQVQSLVGELRSGMPHGTAKKKEKTWGKIHPRSDATALPQLGVIRRDESMLPAEVNQAGLREKPLSELRQ